MEIVCPASEDRAWGRVKRFSRRSKKSRPGLPFPHGFGLLRRVIDTNEALAGLIATLQGTDWVAMDTEADSLHSYPERLCLIQISTASADALIDPLAGLDLAPLWRFLHQHELILHGADYDLRLLRKGHQFQPARLFDTMIAARLLGYERFGLSDLVERHLGVRLEKGPQKMDWGRRPLTDRMRTYASNDTKHLRPLEMMLKEQLSAKGRLAWAEESCQRLIEDTSRERAVDPDHIWRLKGSDRLPLRAACLLKELWHWREAEALRANRPPYFVLSHETLVQLAARAAQRGRVDGLIPVRITGRRRSTLMSTLRHALALPPEAYPSPPRRTGQRMTGREQTRVKQLRTVRDQRAQELALDPSLIASRADLLLLARDETAGVASLMRWQAALLGLT